MEELKEEIKTASDAVEGAADAMECAAEGAANAAEGAANAAEGAASAAKSTASAAEGAANVTQAAKKEKKPKKAKTALLLALFFGEFGIDRIYLGYWILGILKFLTLGGLGIWWVYDVAKIASLQMKDRHGRPLSLN